MEAAAGSPLSVSRRRTWWLTAAIAAPSIAAWTLHPLLRVSGGSLTASAAIVALYVVVDLVPVRLEIRRQTWLFSLAETPMVVGLFLLQPASLLGARLLAMLVVFTIRRTFALHKQALNVAVVQLEVGIACLVFVTLGDRVPTDPLNWLAAGAAAFTAVMAGAGCVYAAISLAQGRPSGRQTVVMLAQAFTFAPFSAGLGLMIALMVAVSPWAVLLAATTFAFIAAGFRAYARVLRRHESLENTYRYSRFLEENRGATEALAAGLDRVRDLLNATTGLIMLTEADAPPIVAWSTADTARPSRPEPPDPQDPFAVRCRTDQRGLRVNSKTGTEQDRQALQARGATEIIAVPLRFGRDVRGHLELWDRQSAQASFTDDDLQFLGNLASHLAAAIENDRLVERLRHAAYHDRLTGLPNREQFARSVDQAIADARRTGGLVAVLLLDLDSFKDINDALGHDYGDDLLVMISQRLREQTSEQDVVARMGADEFAVLCPVTDMAAALARAEALRETLAAGYPLAGLAVEVSVSVGVTIAPDHAQSAGALMQRADVALNHTKSTGRRVTGYLPSMDQATMHRLHLVTQLREAIKNGQIQVLYQPKIALASRDLVGVEALVRWQHPQHGQVMPDQFVPLAEHTGLIDLLTDHVLRTSLGQCRSWLDRGTRIGVAVNLSVRSLLETSFAERIAAILAEYDVPPELLTFEITENNVMTDKERTLPVLDELHRLGVQLSIDDFGTGYSSLAYLRRLPVDEVKIDKDFVLTMGTDLGDMAVVRAIVELGRSLSLRVVAEGVEDELARDLLSSMECEVIQGFMVSRALSAKRLEAWLMARTALGPEIPGLRGRRPQLAG
ncbi:MAG: GGDEF domain-containing protein [Actinobacteria bacterium]|nr:GGDEF domain-containing protein [Actinomycetota bacterium]MBI3685953.1 GGDEF domain-containing protein [Actinomycetota bacterium]